MSVLGRWGRSVLFLCAAAALGGCGDSATAPNPDRDGDGILNEVDQCPDAAETINHVFDSDGCPDTPMDLYVAVRSDVEAYWTTVFASIPWPYSPLTAFTGYTTPLSTPCGVLQLRNAFYCRVNSGVYFDSEFLGAYLAIVGDMAPAFILGHEIGHHVSHLLGWAPPQISNKELELQADCFSGAWMANVQARGLLEEGDLEEAVVTVISVGDPAETWFDPTQHGTAQQRVTAFAVGYGQGPGGCTSSDFFNAFPVDGRGSVAESRLMRPNVSARKIPIQRGGDVS